MHVLVLYESRSGRTRMAADAAGQAAKALKHEVTVKPLSEVTTEDVAAANLVLIGSWVKGFLVVGVGPATNAVKRIAKLPPLGNKACGVFCTFGLDPRHTIEKLAALVAARGGIVVAAHASHHLKPAFGIEGFVRDALNAVPIQAA